MALKRKMPLPVGVTLLVVLIVGCWQCLWAFHSGAEPAVAEYDMLYGAKGTCPQCARAQVGALGIPSLFGSDISVRPGDYMEGSPLVVPELKLIYCSVPKVGCSQMKKLVSAVRGGELRNRARVRRSRPQPDRPPSLFPARRPTRCSRLQLFRVHNRANHSHGWDEWKFEVDIHDPKITGLHFLREYSIQQANEMMHDPTWTRIVLVRDPVERFFSAFADKCWGFWPNYNCPVGDPFSQADHGIQEALSVLESQIMPNGTLTAADSMRVDIRDLNAHFVPQSVLCDLRFTAPAYVKIPFPRATMPDMFDAVLAQLDVNASDPTLKPTTRKWARQLFEPTAPSNNGSTQSVLLMHHVQRLAGELPENPAIRGALAPKSNLTNLDPQDYKTVNMTRTTAQSVLARIRKLYAADYAVFGNLFHRP